jgi:hypothetical protein
VSRRQTRIDLDTMSAEFTAVGMRFNEEVPGENARALLNLAVVLLLPEPSNKFDPNAVLVCDPADGRPLAHVSRDTLASLPVLPPEGLQLPVFHSVSREKAVLFRCTTPLFDLEVN